MIGALVSFELVRRVKMISTYVYGVLMFAAGFFMMLAAGGVFRNVAVSSGNERVMVNGPQALFSTIGTVALLALFTVAAIFGQAAYQDFGHGTWMIIFTKNVKKMPYLVGRFLGAFVFSCVLFLAIGLGQAAGSIVVWKMHPETLGPTSVLAYLWPYIVHVWPMLFFTGAIFFSLAALTRRMTPVYVGAVVLVLGYFLMLTLISDVENLTLASLLDPFGFLAFSNTTRYWTPSEQNVRLVSLFGLFGLNRLIWTMAGVAALVVAVRRFRTTVDEHAGRPTDDDPADKALVDGKPGARIISPPRTMTPLGWARAALRLASMYVKEILRSGVFWALITAGVIFGTMTVLLTKAIFGTATLPVTYQALEMTVGGFRLFSIIIVTLYAGELVWRERDVGVQDIVDATPSPSWVGFVAKLLALLGVALAIEGAVAVVALVSQLARGYFAIEPRLYFTELVMIDFTKLALASVLALVIQIAVNHKYVGHALMVVYYIATTIFRVLGIEDPLLRYGSETTTTYSDMNGYGSSLWPFAWLRFYWVGFAILLLVLAYVLSPRGRETKLRTRWSLGKRRVGGGAIVALAIGALTFLGAGGFVYYNTHILNPYETAKDAEREHAEYEKKYKTVQSAPQPTIVGADVKVDLFPEARRLVAKGTYRLKNKLAVPIERVMLDVPEHVKINELRIGDAQPRDVDEKLGVRFVVLGKPLLPGEEIDLVYAFEFAPKGFRHGGPGTGIVGNGTFVNNGILPVVGYQRNQELESDGDRKSYGFAPKERMAPRDDPKEINHNYIRQDSDFITFAATVSTSADQIAMAPGYLEKEWQEGGRRYFRYVMDQPILNFFSVLSARYAVKEDEWNGVKLQILYHPTHTANLDRMMNGMKDSLAYCSEAFGPYQHHQARILEFPRYSSFAQSFPNTIPYSEAVGFIARVRDDDPEDVDYPYYITAHEIAHQWWAHQVVGANVRGATMTSESLAQYSALMVMQKKYGKERMRRYLKFELDGYLRGRFSERKKELPLAQNENQQYIHYQKGSLAMYALQDYIGEDRVNRALKKVVERWKFKGPPYARSIDVLDAFREETPPEYAYLIDDLFETITLYDNRTRSAKVKQNGDGTWEVTLEVLAKKLKADAQGVEAEVDFHDWVDVGALDENGYALFVEKRKVDKGASEIRFVVPRKPTKVGIDPLNKLIDRDSSDNVVVPTAG